jgi:hypothetical protein
LFGDGLSTVRTANWTSTHSVYHQINIGLDM